MSVVTLQQKVKAWDSVVGRREGEWGKDGGESIAQVGKDLFQKVSGLLLLYFSIHFSSLPPSLPHSITGSSLAR